MWSHKCRSKRFACLEIDPSQLEVQANGKVRIFISAEMKSSDPDCRVPHIVVDAPDCVRIHPKPIDELHRKGWPGRGVAEHDLQSEIEAKEPTQPLLTGKGA